MNVIARRGERRASLDSNSLKSKTRKESSHSIVKCGSSRTGLTASESLSSYGSSEFGDISNRSKNRSESYHIMATAVDDDQLSLPSTSDSSSDSQTTLELDDGVSKDMSLAPSLLTRDSQTTCTRVEDELGSVVSYDDDETHDSQTTMMDDHATLPSILSRDSNTTVSANDKGKKGGRTALGRSRSQPSAVSKQQPPKTPLGEHLAILAGRGGALNMTLFPYPNPEPNMPMRSIALDQSEDRSIADTTITFDDLSLLSYGSASISTKETRSIDDLALVYNKQNQRFNNRGGGGDRQKLNSAYGFDQSSAPKELSAHTRGTASSSDKKKKTKAFDGNNSLSSISLNEFFKKPAPVTGKSSKSSKVSSMPSLSSVSEVEVMTTASSAIPTLTSVSEADIHSMGDALSMPSQANLTSSGSVSVLSMPPSLAEFSTDLANITDEEDEDEDEDEDSHGHNDDSSMPSMATFRTEDHTDHTRLTAFSNYDASTIATSSVNYSGNDVSPIHDLPPDFDTTLSRNSKKCRNATDRPPISPNIGAKPERGAYARPPTPPKAKQSGKQAQRAKSWDREYVAGKKNKAQDQPRRHMSTDSGHVVAAKNLTQIVTNTPRRAQFRRVQSARSMATTDTKQTDHSWEDEEGSNTTSSTPKFNLVNPQKEPLKRENTLDRRRNHFRRAQSERVFDEDVTPTIANKAHLRATLKKKEECDSVCTPDSRTVPRKNNPQAQLSPSVTPRSHRNGFRLAQSARTAGKDSVSASSEVDNFVTPTVSPSSANARASLSKSLEKKALSASEHREGLSSSSQNKSSTQMAPRRARAFRRAQSERNFGSKEQDSEKLSNSRSQRRVSNLHEENKSIESKLSKNPQSQRRLSTSSEDGSTSSSQKAPSTRRKPSDLPRSSDHQTSIKGLSPHGGGRRTFARSQSERRFATETPGYADTDELGDHNAEEKEQLKKARNEERRRQMVERSQEAKLCW